MMNNDQIDERIDEIERALMRDDPQLASRFFELDTRTHHHDRAVLALIVASAIFLALGLMAMSALAWLAGALSYVMAFIVDHHGEHRRRPTSRSPSRQVDRR